MKIIGESYQDGVPSPENPVEIKHEQFIIVNDKNGNQVKIPFTEQFKDIQNSLIQIEKVDGEWYATFKPSI